MWSRLRVALVILFLLSLPGAWLCYSMPGSAGAALWNPYDAVAEIKLPSSVEYPSMRAVEEYRGYVYVLDRSGTLYTYDARDLPNSTTFGSYSAPIASLEVGVGYMLMLGHELGQE